MDGLKVTSGAEWRKPREEGALLLLPSGRVVRVRAISLDTCVILGFIPDGLSRLVIDVFMGKESLADTIETLAQLKDEIQYWEVLCRTCLLEPRVVDNPQAEDEISLEDLEPGDKQHIASVVLRPAHELRPFCQQQNAFMESILNQQALRPTPQPDSEPEQVGE